MKKKFDLFFKNKLDVPKKAPDDAWDFIQARIPEKKKRPIVPLWGKISGVIALVLLSFGVGYWANDGNKHHKSEENNLQIAGQPAVSQETNEDTPSKENPVNESNFNTNTKPNENNFIPYSTTGINNSVNNQNNVLPNLSETNETLFVFAGNNQDFNKGIHPMTEQNSNLKQSIIGFEIPMAVAATQNEEYFAVNYPAEGYDLIPFGFMNHTLSESIKDFSIKESSNFKKEKIKPKMDFNRFHLSGFVSPMALNTFVGSSMLSDDMSNYKTINNITLAYGMKGAYSLGPAIKIRTGISMIGFEQVTKNVPLASQVAQSPNGSLQLANNNVTYKSDVRLNPQANPNKSGEVGISSFGDIKQQSQYVEIPLEAEVSLFQTSSIGISATGGGSTWLLSKNKIFVYTDGHTEELGKASNLNKAVLSANAGLKFDMKISDAVQINVEPSFKYLFNPVNNIEEYNPYTIGVNAGITVSLK